MSHVCVPSSFMGGSVYPGGKLLKMSEVLVLLSDSSMRRSLVAAVIVVLMNSSFQ